jgi:hypothetical protein
MTCKIRAECSLDVQLLLALETRVGDYRSARLITPSGKG